ncbi:MAG: helix-turn-helix transcriptional regulator [Alphaproteobacteria bacterium]|nr:helix-turn-helix transcriptional regulator [Alphaproteobacteria bacterium]
MAWRLEWETRGMNRTEHVLATMATMPDAEYRPLHVQKLFFLMDRQVPEAIGGPRFNFTPYDYGPFDPQVYRELETLAQAGLIKIENRTSRDRIYKLTEKGREAGVELRKAMDLKAQEYSKAIVSWMLPLRFDEIVRAVYQSYPEMRSNSVFRG